MISDYEEVVIRFKAYRISYPLTQKELSDKSGVSLRSITRFESGEDISHHLIWKMLKQGREHLQKEKQILDLNGGKMNDKYSGSNALGHKNWNNSYE